MKRFWDKIKKGAGCWEWQACRDRAGYGQFRFQGRMWKAPRVAWTLVRGEILDDLCVLHRCDNPGCCNPAHLFLGTHADNAADRDRKGRSCTGEKNGCARLTERDVEVIRRLYRPGRVTQEQLAARFGVSRQLVSQVVNRNVWRHV